MGRGGRHNFYQAAQFLLWSKEFAIWFLELGGLPGHEGSSQAGSAPLAHRGMAVPGPEQPPTPTGNRAGESASLYTQYSSPFLSSPCTTCLSPAARVLQPGPKPPRDADVPV